MPLTNATVDATRSRSLMRTRSASEAAPISASCTTRTSSIERRPCCTSFRSASVKAATATRTIQRPTRARADSASRSVSRMSGPLSRRAAESMPSVIFSPHRAPRAGP